MVTRCLELESNWPAQPSRSLTWTKWAKSSRYHRNPKTTCFTSVFGRQTQALFWTFLTRARAEISFANCCSTFVTFTSHACVKVRNFGSLFAKRRLSQFWRQKEWSLHSAMGARSSVCFYFWTKSRKCTTWSSQNPSSAHSACWKWFRPAAVSCTILPTTSYG